MRLQIAESTRFAELRDRSFDFGTLPTVEAIRLYLQVESEIGSVDAAACEFAPAQFLAMIASAVFWPRLVHPNWTIDDAAIHRAIAEAVHTIVARYSVSPVERLNRCGDS